MSNFAVYGRRIAAAAAGISILGVATATCADAAPATPDPPDTAVPKISDLPVPIIFQPLDASEGLLGIPRGSIPGVATPDMDLLPGLAVVPLPKKDAPEPDVAAAPETAPAPDQPAAPASDTTSVPARPASAMAGLDDADFVTGLTGAVPAG